MSRRLLRREFFAISAGLLQPLAGCTLTSDTFHPERVLQASAPADAGWVEPAPIASEPSDGGASSSCVGREELAGCALRLVPSGLACSSDVDCETRACVAGTCAAATCRDGMTNGDESGQDCGGSCPVACAVQECADDATDCARPCAARCAAGDSCIANTDCDVGLFCPEQTRRCTTFSCRDSALNGSEILTDCGGGDCPGCPVGTACSTGTDCVTGVCDPSGVCPAATCDDGVRNQNETAVDCGGACQDCLVGQACANGRDCQSRVCNSRRCGPGIDSCCQAPSCSDGVANGTEPVADCGNAACGACPVNSPCTANGQCGSGLCQAGSCRLPPCANLQQDGTESDIDCGGNCGACVPGLLCSADADCQSGACEDGRCCGGVLGDCTRCARRLVLGLTCSTNGDAALSDCEAFLQCLADNPSVCPVRHADGCSDAPEDPCFHESFGGNAGPGVVLADSILGTAQCFF
jgi:hypothetical protein